jgi:formimidoylglutamase
MTGRITDFEWDGPSDDPDERFGDVVETRPLSAVDTPTVFVGEPYDGAVVGRRGTSEGPAAIRRSLARTRTHHVGSGPVASVADAGDVEIPDDDVRAVQRAVRSVAEEVHAADAIPVFLGGDGSLTHPNAAPLLDDGTVGVLSFDAHLDCRPVDDEPTNRTAYRQLFAAGLDALSVVGVRHFETATAEHDFLHDRRGHVVTPVEVATAPLDALDDAIAALGDVDVIYVSLDVDVLDAAAAPGTSAATPGGVSTRELYRMLYHVTHHGRVAGFEVVECAPALDRDRLTVDASARAVAHFIAGLEAGQTGTEDRYHEETT